MDERAERAGGHRAAGAFREFGDTRSRSAPDNGAGSTTSRRGQSTLGFAFLDDQPKHGVAGRGASAPALLLEIPRQAIEDGPPARRCHVASRGVGVETDVSNDMATKE
jgi:hypothetical protein